MLKDRIISTIKFFDLQDYPLTLLELHKFLISEKSNLVRKIDGQGEIIDDSSPILDTPAGIDEILNAVEAEKSLGKVGNTLGFYHLPGREGIAKVRLENYIYGLKREKLIKKFSRGLKYLPFIRGVALGGSQAMGMAKPGSDIDLLIVTDQRFLWLGRTVATLYFQILGKRRHGKKIANRFCLNHYLAGPKALGEIKNLYSAMEYARLRPIVVGEAVINFQKNNLNWIRQFFPQWQPTRSLEGNFPSLQRTLERLFSGRLGGFLEAGLKYWQLARIKKDKFIIVEEDELSFHPDSKQHPLLQKFFFG